MVRDMKNLKLYILRFLHQTTTMQETDNLAEMLYILRFLHQTTTSQLGGCGCYSCISCVFYIKPQLAW